MKLNLATKLINSHLISGNLEENSEISIRVDQTLSQDATGTLSYLQFEATGTDRVKTDLSVSYVDHNMLQADYRNADDHSYLQDVAAKYGIYFSRPGNGICHQVHLERFAVPGTSLLGTDSHTPTCGAIGALAIGSGGLDVAVAMAGGPYFLRMPKIVGVELTGSLRFGVTAKDVILEMLRRLTVRGGIGRIFEYYGSGIKTLTVPERSTIANMGAELGATTSIFPSDNVTKQYLEKQDRGSKFVQIESDEGAHYDEKLTINLSELEPLISCPDSPDLVVPVSQVSGTKVDQVAIGSCTNSSYSDLMEVANVLKGRMVHPDVTMSLSPGSRQVLQMISANGALADIVSAGVRLLESACGPCAGIGQVPRHGAVSVRSFNRNFPGRSGGLHNGVYLTSPLVCAVTALKGEIVDPRDFLGEGTKYITIPEKYLTDDLAIIPPADDPSSVDIRRGPNIKPIPRKDPIATVFTGQVLIKLEDNISTDHILPAGTVTLALRSNIPAISEYVFSYIDSEFVNRVKNSGKGFIVAGENYGQGSSREHAALCPSYLGIQAIIAKSFARIHKDNLINYGVLPITFKDYNDYDELLLDNNIEIIDIVDVLETNQTQLTVSNITAGQHFKCDLEITARQREILLAGGLINHTG
tara:strand:- start:16184 stop:18109 length:1926 start_codon:yes stop_codon:yes gene_type:complete